MSDGWVVAECETEERPQVRAVRCFRNRGEASAEGGADVQKEYNQLVCELQALGARPHASLGAALTGAF